MKNVFIILLLICSCYACAGSNTSNNEKEMNDLPEELTFVFYNIENLFDIYDTPGKDDKEYTPNGDKQWNEERYYTKIANIAKVLTDINDEDWPAIIGLSEIENKVVLEDLIAHQNLINAGYGIVHFESPDTRGIDVALLYRKEYFTLSHAENIAIDFDFNEDIKTRDILYATGEFSNGETFHFFVNHWPSRREGVEESEIKRLTAAQVLREKIDEIIADNEDAKIFVMGDFNDYPEDKSITEVLDAGTLDNNLLYNLAAAPHEEDEGSIIYKGDWGMIDQMIVSKSIIGDNGIVVKEKNVEIFDEEWMMYFDKKYEEYKPDRTYGGDNYYGGYSDHLPIYIELEVKK